jgi:lipopolysaccharide export system protein LptA
MTRTVVCALLLLGALADAQMQVDELRLPISLDAESTDYDGKNSMLLFRGLRLTQGSIGVVADIGRASQLDFEQATWQFSGNVRIDVEGGHIECDDADLEFNNHVLTLATIEGSPATFEMRRPNSEEVTYAEAEQLRYNLADGIVTFAGNAKITEGGNQIASNSLVYNIVERRINAQSTGDGEDRVKITYTPPPTGDADGGTTADGEAPGNEDTTGSEEPESP